MQYVKITVPTWRKIERIIKEFDRLGFSHSGHYFKGGDETILIRNNTDVQCERFNILQISGVAVTPQQSLQDFQQRPVFIGDIPTETPGVDEQPAICAEPIASGHIGRAWADGIVMTKISVTDESHTYAKIKHNDMGQLESSTTGMFFVVWKESGTGTKWAVVRVGGGGSSGAGDRWAYIKEMPRSNDGGQLECRLDDALTGEIVDVHFVLLNCSGVGAGHLSLTIDTPIRVAKRGDNWWFVGCIEGTEETTCD